MKKPVLTGADAFVYKLFGRIKSRTGLIKKYLLQAREIDRLNKVIQNWPEDKLAKRLGYYKSIFRSGKTITPAQLYEAFSCIQEAVHLKLGFRPYTVQLAGALVMYDGFIAEMSTGEGKTVTAAMLGVVRGWSGEPCHILTSNDYLAKRDAEELKEFYSFCGVQAGYVISKSTPEERKRNYDCELTYSTAKEVLADFLRDRIQLNTLQKYERRILHQAFNPTKRNSGVVMRGLFAAIVDEADNVLIDEAVTPLIISRQQENEAFVEACKLAYNLAQKLKKDSDYAVNTEFRNVHFLHDPEDLVLAHRGELNSVYCGMIFQKDLVRQAIMAKEFFHKNQQYVIEDGKVVIVDEATGRKMPMRSWSGGLHQMIEVSEGLEPTSLNETQARLSFQRYFRFYKKFCGMTGTAREAGMEFWHLYDLPVLKIPNHKQSRRTIFPLRFYQNNKRKISAVLNEIKKVQAEGRPILVGTRSVEISEEIARQLKEDGYVCEVVNAVREEQEAEIVKRAGEKQAITVATNMAGRGTDIKLSREVNSIGGLHVIATECHESPRVDRQLFGRSARQGDYGSAVAFACWDDELFQKNLPVAFMRILSLVYSIFPLRIIGGLAVKVAQYIAQKKDYNARFSVQKSDMWIKDSLSFASDEVQV